VSQKTKPEYQLKQEAFRRLAKMARKPKESNDWNPLLKFPPNKPCPCGSGKKFKRCCRVGMPAVLPKEEVEGIKAGKPVRFVRETKK